MPLNTFFVLAALLASFASAQTQWKQVETLRYDWAGSGKPATLVLEIASDFARGGDFTRVRIVTPGNPEFVLLDQNGLANFRTITCQYKEFGLCRKANLVSSDRLFFYRLPSGQTLLFVFGWPYGSSPGSLHALALDAEGMPHEILSLKEFDLDDMIDVDGDGAPEFVGKKCFSEEWGTHLLSYDPYSVYRLPKAPAGNATYSLQLSKQYNLKNYFGWAGPDCREDVAVVLHPRSGGKPIIVNSKEAEKLSGK
jgi:hypothetical protein